MQTFHIVPGYRCNKLCGHCANDSGPGRRGGLSDAEHIAVKEHIRATAPAELMFTGGEPTLYIDSINDIISSHPSLERCRVHVTTNGWFLALPETKFRAVLSKISRLNSVQLSFDTFHGNASNLDSVVRLRDYCREKSIDFNVSVSISSVEQAAAASAALASIQCDVVLSKVEASGRAKSNSLSFFFPIFDSAVLDMTCPNLHQMSFHPQKGFSVCCANLVYNGSKTGIAHKSAASHTESQFFKALKVKTFGEKLAELGLTANDLKPEHSLACNLCEFLEERRIAQEAV